MRCGAFRIGYRPGCDEQVVEDEHDLSGALEEGPLMHGERVKVVGRVGALSGDGVESGFAE